MTRVLVTGAAGFIGRNLTTRLARREDIQLYLFDMGSSDEDLAAWSAECDVVVHLAGTNRPPRVEDFEAGNAGFTHRLCEALRGRALPAKVVMTSSVQAALDNPYGRSKRAAETALENLARETGAPVSVHRLKNVFGKWCRPNYNSVTATFCHNIAHELPITISDPSQTVDLVYVDDVVVALVAEIESPSAAPPDCRAPDSIPSCVITLGDLAGRIQTLHEMRDNLVVPDFRVRFNQCLYATFLTYRPLENMSYPLETKADLRGNLAEFIKSKHFGQLFVSRTRPGVTRGNHYHDTKTEKFLVIEGEGLIRMRPIESDKVTEVRVSSNTLTVVDIPPGVTHSIDNVGGSDLIALFWASEIFDPDRPDTHYLAV